MASQVDENLQDVLEEWSGIEGKPYGHGKHLKNLWVRGHPTTPLYDPTGIIELRDKIRSNDFFRDCEKARELKPGHFIEAGGIKTVGKLFQFLRTCEEET
jgi:hypothetical protein